MLGLGRGPPWPRLALAGQAAGSSGAATEHRQASVAGSGSFVDGEHYSVARPGGRQRPAVALLWPAAAWLVRAEEGRSKESSGSDGVPAHISHGERDAEERKREQRAPFSAFKHKRGRGGA